MRTSRTSRPGPRSAGPLRPATREPAGVQGARARSRPRVATPTLARSRPSRDAPINAGLVFCVGSHPVGSTWLGRDLVTGNARHPARERHVTGVNTSHGTWKCLDSTSLTDWRRALAEHHPAAHDHQQADLCVPRHDRCLRRLGAAFRHPLPGDRLGQPLDYAHGFRARARGPHLQALFATGRTAFERGAEQGGGFSARRALVRGHARRRRGPGALLRRRAAGSAARSRSTGANVDWAGQPARQVLNRSSSSQGEGTDGRCFTAAIWTGC